MPDKPRGFAAMDAAKQREIASKGGKAAHEKGTAHEFTSEEAREAGRKGGMVVSQDRRHMAEIGREGGMSSHGGRSHRREGQNKDDNAGTTGNGSPPPTRSEAAGADGRGSVPSGSIDPPRTDREVSM